MTQKLELSSQAHGYCILAILEHLTLLNWNQCPTFYNIIFRHSQPSSCTRCFFAKISLAPSKVLSIEIQCRQPYEETLH